MQDKSPRKREDDHRLAERAAEWLGVLKNPSAAERAEFVEWITASPRHAEEFLFVTALMRELGRMEIEDFERVRQILGEGAANVVPLFGASANEGAAVDTRRSVASKRSRRWAAGIAASLAILAAAGWHLAIAPQTYATAIGEQRVVELTDGSIVHLSTRSQMSVKLTEHARDIQLLEGEALFKVERDPARPFRVHAGNSVIEAVGTQFDVHRRPSGVTVAVVEGVVAISSQRFGAGEEARIALDGTIERRRPIEAMTVAAWRQSRLTFLSDTLTDIAAEFNRHNRTPKIVVEDEAAGARRYSGVFNSSDPQSLIDFLREDADLAFEQRGDELRVRQQ